LLGRRHGEEGGEARVAAEAVADAQKHHLDGLGPVFGTSLRQLFWFGLLAFSGFGSEKSHSSSV